MKPGLTPLQLSEKTGAGRLSIKHWLQAEGVKPVSSKKWKDRMVHRYDEAQALAVILPRVRHRAKTNGEANLDPETGLTWHQRKERAEALAKERENEIADKLKNEEWVSAAFMHSKFSNFVIALEQIPGKLKSESGLTDKQALAVRRAIDEARESASKEVEKEENED